MKKINYQSVKVKYPKNLYAIAVWLIMDGETLPYFTDTIYPNIKTACRGANRLIHNLNKKEKQALEDLVIIQPLIFNSEVPLFKKYWENPAVEVSVADKTRLYYKAALKPRLYDLLIVPNFVDVKGKREVVFRCAYIFDKNPKQSDVEAFMLSSTFFVSPEAKNSAIYSIDDSYGYRISDGEVLVKEKYQVN